MYFSMTLPRKYRNKNYRRVNGGMIGEDCGFNSHFWPLQRFGMLTHRRGSFTGRLSVQYVISSITKSIQIEACLINPTFYRRSHSKGPKERVQCASNKNKTFHRKACCATHRLLSHLFNLYDLNPNKTIRVYCKGYDFRIFKFLLRYTRVFFIRNWIFSQPQFLK